MTDFILSLVYLALLFATALGGGERTFLHLCAILMVCSAFIHFRSAYKGRWYRLRNCFWYLPILGGVGGMLWLSDLRAVVFFVVSSLLFSIVAMCTELAGRRFAESHRK